MRQFINIITEFKTDNYLQGIFYHGTAIEKPDGFWDGSVAYFTQNREEATGYAWMDSEVDGDPPLLITVRLHCNNPATLDTFTMQDLAQTQEGREKAIELREAGYDCVVSNDYDHDEVCVLDPTKIEIIETINLPYRK